MDEYQLRDLWYYIGWQGRHLDDPIMYAYYQHWINNPQSALLDSPHLIKKLIDDLAKRNITLQEELNKLHQTTTPVRHFWEGM